MTATALLALCLLAAAPGKAPSPEEARLFDEGMRAFQAGNPRDADKAWRAGYALGKDPAFLVRMGEAEEKAGQPADAVESYRRYLRAAPDAADRAEIEQRVARLAPAGEATPGATPAGAAAPAGANETPGAFGAGAGAAGPPASPASPSPPSSSTSAAAPSSAPARDDEVAARPGQEGDGAEDERGWTPYNVTAWVATGATVLLLGVAGYYAASAGSEKDDVNMLLRYQNPDTGAPLEYQNVAARYQGATKAGQRDDRLAKDALYVAAGAAVVATTFFIIDALREPEEQHAEGDRGRAAASPRVGLLLAPGAPTGGARPNGLTALSSLQWSF